MGTVNPQIQASIVQYKPVAFEKPAAVLGQQIIKPDGSTEEVNLGTKPKFNADNTQQVFYLDLGEATSKGSNNLGENYKGPLTLAMGNEDKLLNLHQLVRTYKPDITTLRGGDLDGIYYEFDCDSDGKPDFTLIMDIPEDYLDENQEGEDEEDDGPIIRNPDPRMPTWPNKDVKPPTST